MAIIVGDSTNNTINGTIDPTDNIQGLGGDDQIFGDGGIDTIFGGSGNDTIDGGAQDDAIDGGSGDDRLIGGLGVDTITGGLGNDSFVITAQAEIGAGESYSGGTGFDKISILGTVGTPIDISAISISADIEAIEASSLIPGTFLSVSTAVSMTATQLGAFQSVNTGAITLTGAGLADLTNADVFNPTTFNLSASGNNLNLTGVTNASYTVNGGVANDVITGGDNALGDLLYGGGGRDIIYGGAGNDRIVGGAIGDTQYGGNGIDTFAVLAATDIASLEAYAGGAGMDTLSIETGALVDLTLASINADVENFVALGAVKMKATQLGNFQSVSTGGAITLTNGGIADLTGAQVTTTTFNLAGLATTFTLTGVNNTGYTVNGGAGADTIRGGEHVSGDTLYGGGGADTIYGGAGNDRIVGGALGDFQDGGSGNDTFAILLATDVAAHEAYIGGLGVDTLSIETASLVDLSLATLVGDVEKLASIGAVKMTAAELGTFQSVNTGAITLTDGGSAADLSGDEVFTNTFNLSAGGNTLYLVGVNTTSYTVNGGAAGDYIIGGDYVGGDTLYGGGSVDIMYGGAGNDRIVGGAFGDYQQGDAGNDTFAILLASDIASGETYVGGTGVDTLSVETDAWVDLSAASIGSDVENFTAFAAVKMTSGQLGTFESVGTGGPITLTDGGFADLTGARVLTSMFNLSALGNRLDLTGVADATYNVTGGAVGDMITGGNNAFGDTLNGNGGDDTIYGGGGADRISGGIGADQLYGGLGNDTFVYVGNDVYYGNDIVAGEAVNGGAGFDTIEFQTSLTGVNISALTIAADVEGLNTYGKTVFLTAAQLDKFTSVKTYGAGVSLTTSGTVNLSDATFVHSATFTLNPTGNYLTLAGLSGNYSVNGGTTTDTIIGGDNIDTLNGGGGNDAIYGREGSDTLIGGIGNDLFIFDTVANAFNIDTIQDFSVPNDTIRFDDAVYTSLTAGVLAAGSFVIGASAVDANDFIIYDNTIGALYYDSDGNGAALAVQVATLSASLAMTNADFFIV